MLKKITKLFYKGGETEQEIKEPDSSLTQGINTSALKLNAEELKKIGNSYFDSGDLANAEYYYQRSVDLDPSLSSGYANLGVIRNAQGKLDDAIYYYNKAIALKPDFAQAYCNLGLILNDLKRYDEALSNLDLAIKFKPDLVFAHNNRGMVLVNLCRYEDAITNYDYAISLKPDYAEAHNNRGSALNKLKKPKDALKCYEYAISLKPDYAEALVNKGGILINLNRLDEALSCYKIAIEVKPDFALAYVYESVALKRLGRSEEALKHVDKAIALNADLHEAHKARGEILSTLKRLEEALISFDRALLLKPEDAETHNDRGSLLSNLKRYNEALKSHERAIELEQEHEYFYGYWLEVKQILFDWSNYNDSLDFLKEKINYGKSPASLLQVLWCLDSPALQKKAAENFVLLNYPSYDLLPKLFKNSRSKKIRVGYFSADFRNHPVSFLTAELFEKHDKTKFELIAFSLSNTEDDMTRRIANAFDRFVDVSCLSDQKVALMARELEIDIAIDLGGFTEGCRTGIFALRAAPVQVNYLGFPGTMGADYMDYIIADKTTIPPSHQQYYTEKIAYLPSFQVNDSKRVISDRKFSREELGLPSVGFVYCCFNNITKINPSIFDSWMRILKQVEGSVLWMLGENETAVNNLMREVVLRGVDANRIVFAKRETLPDYLARYRMADLFLDTLPFNAGTTASDALWAGLPVLTQIGESFAGRMAASLLYAIGLPELISKTKKDYEALAVELAKNPANLAKIKQKLAENRLTTPLFDIDYFTKHIESAYNEMYERSQAGLAPNHIHTI